MVGWRFIYIHVNASISLLAFCLQIVCCLGAVWPLPVRVSILYLWPPHWIQHTHTHAHALYTRRRAERKRPQTKTDGVPFFDFLFYFAALGCVTRVRYGDTYEHIQLNGMKMTRKIAIVYGWAGRESVCVCGPERPIIKGIVKYFRYTRVPPVYALRIEFLSKSKKVEKLMFHFYLASKPCLLQTTTKKYQRNKTFVGLLRGCVNILSTYMNMRVETYEQATSPAIRCAMCANCKSKRSERRRLKTTVASAAVGGGLRQRQHRMPSQFILSHNDLCVDMGHGNILQSVVFASK